MDILIVDDEPPARARLRQLLADIGGHRCTAEAADGVAALEQCAATAPDVVLLDIRMPRMDGLEAARHLADMADPPALIFTTAYDDFALAAFETNAVHYLVKPVKRDALTQGLERAAERRGIADHGAAALAAAPRSHLSVRTGERLRLIPVAEVLCLRANQKYVEIMTAEDTWLTEASLTGLEQEFGEWFIRVHRNALVRTNAIAGLDRTTHSSTRVVINGLPEEIEVSRRHLPSVRKSLKQRERR